jgi:hypothetical protein
VPAKALARPSIKRLVGNVERRKVHIPLFAYGLANREIASGVRGQVLGTIDIQEPEPKLSDVET